MLNPFQIELNNIEDTQRFAETIGELLKASCKNSGVTIGLCGEIGAGKTTFTRLLVKYLGSKDHASSPTFTLCQEYSTPDFKVEHWDLYRLKAEFPEELEQAPDIKVCRIVEWIDKNEVLIDDLRFTFRYNPEGDFKRTVELSGILLDKIDTASLNKIK